MQTIRAPSTVPGADVVVAGDQFHGAYPLHHLVAELCLQPQPEWRAECDREHLAVHGICEQRLRRASEPEIDDAVVVAMTRLLPFVVERAKNDVASVGSGPATFQKGIQRNALPFADVAPPLDAFVKGDLLFGPDVPQFLERQRQRLFDEASSPQSASR